MFASSVRIGIVAVAVKSPAVHLWRICLLLAMAGSAQSAQIAINGPVGSGEFGRTVTVLSNGSIVVTDPGFDATALAPDSGAVYLFRPDGTLISTLVGSSSNDRIGSGGVLALANGNFVVRSPDWDLGPVADAGAVTFVSAVAGMNGVVSATNSLVGSSASDRVGASGVTALSNGNYVVRSHTWDNGDSIDAGAVTFVSGTSGISGAVSADNSLVGGSADDRVGEHALALLTNGNYVVRSPTWDNGAAVNAGAVTFGSGITGISGLISPSNSLVGTSAADLVGSPGITALINGNYVVRSANWNNGPIPDAGAATFASGTTGVTGIVSASNSLIGSTANDFVGRLAVTPLANGNYVVVSENWDNGNLADVGAATFASGQTGISGAVSPANSLIGLATGDQVGLPGVTALSNGNYVVTSENWDHGAIANAGAATFGSGTTGIFGVVSTANSLVGSAAFDSVGSGGVIALSNGNYVVSSPFWDRAALNDVGAVSFGLGTTGITGAVSMANSLVGSSGGDQVGSSGITTLTNGNYVVLSQNWDHGGIGNAGAATFGLGTIGIAGTVSPMNSLVGSSVADQVGAFGARALSTGNYVVRTNTWDNGSIIDAGAVTFGSGTSGIAGPISSSNSLVGSMANDFVGSSGVTALPNGNYLVRSELWNNGLLTGAGAVTLGSGTSGLTGQVSAANSLVGSSAHDGIGLLGVVAFANSNFAVASSYWNNLSIVDAGAVTLGLADGSVVGAISFTHSVLGTVAGEGVSHSFGYDGNRNQLVVGQPASNRVVLQRTGAMTTTSITGDAPEPSCVGEPVTLVATVSADPSGPTDGQVTFVTNGGERCVDPTPTASSASTAEFSCAITLMTEGSLMIVAEYTGSISHAYSASLPELHVTCSDRVFADGFD